MPTLALYRGTQSIRYVELGQADLTIGRALESDIVLEDSSRKVSRHHADVRYERGQYRVIGQPNTNGVWMGSQQLESYVLRDGDEIEIGPYRLVFHEAAIDAAITESGPYPVRDETTRHVVPQPPVNVASPTTKSHIPKDAAPKKPGRLPVPLVLGAVALGIVVILLIAWLTRQPDRVVKEQPTPPTPTPLPVATPPPPPPTPGPSELEASLATAQAALDANDLDAAGKALASAQLLDPDDVRAKELKEQLDKKLAAVTPVANPNSSGTDRVPRDVASVFPSIPARPNESFADRVARARKLQDQFKAAQDKLGRGDWRGASSEVQAIQSGEPNYPGLDALKGEIARLQAAAAESQRQESLRTHLANGRAFEALATADALGKARSEYEAAQELADAKAALQRLQELLAKMKQDGDAAFRQAQRHDALGRPPDARAAYEQVVKLLPAGDPNRTVAERRLAEMRPK